MRRQMRLQGLAEQVYQLLRARVPAEAPCVSYQGVVDALGPQPEPYDNLAAFDPRLWDALGEIGDACHRHRPPLPALSSIVVQKQEDGSLGMPGSGYYLATHPDARTEIAKLEAWVRELDRAKCTNYPPNL